MTIIHSPAREQGSSDSRATEAVGATPFWSVEYEDERLNPKTDQRWYLVLSDLRLALGEYASDASIEILDFGCGGSPYRSLFPRASYKRADISLFPGVDYLID